MVGPGGFEPPTSRLSAGRSTRLSYGPLFLVRGLRVIFCILVVYISYSVLYYNARLLFVLEKGFMVKLIGTGIVI